MSDRTYYVNGELVPVERAAIAVRDRGFLYGDAAFETLRAYDGQPFHWRAHLERLRHTCRRLGIEPIPNATTLREAVDETLTANAIENAYVRLSLTRGVQPGTLAPSPTVEPGVVIIVKPLPPGGPDGQAVWDGPASVVTADTRKPPADAIPPTLKTHNYLNGILARLEAREAAADEALLLTGDGTVAEGTTSNCFFVTDDVLHTPTTDLPLLPGITRDIVMSLAQDRTIPVECGQYPADILRAADEVFLTNTTWEIRPVGTVDGEGRSVGPITARLAAAFDTYVEAWLDGGEAIDIDRWGP